MAWCAPTALAKRTDDDVAAAFAALGPRVSVERVLRPADAWWQVDPGEPPRLEGRRLRPPARRRLAPCVVLGHHQGTPRGAPYRERARSSSSRRTRSSRPHLPRAQQGKRRRSGELAVGVSWNWPACPGAHWSGRSCTACSSRTEFDAPDLAAAVAAAVERETAWRNVDLGNTEAVVSGLCAAIDITPRADGRRHLAPRHRTPRPARRARLRDTARRAATSPRARCTWPTWPTC